MLSHRSSITNQIFLHSLLIRRKREHYWQWIEFWCSFFAQAKERTSSLYQDKAKKGTKEYSLLIWRKKGLYGQQEAEEEYIYGLQHSSAMKKMIEKILKKFEIWPVRSNLKFYLFIVTLQWSSALSMYNKILHYSHSL